MLYTLIKTIYNIQSSILKRPKSISKMESKSEMAEKKSVWLLKSEDEA